MPAGIENHIFVRSLPLRTVATSIHFEMTVESGLDLALKQISGVGTMVSPERKVST